MLVIGLVMAPFMYGIGYFRSATARGDAQAVARNALDAMTRELSQASYVQLDMYDAGSVAFAPPLLTDPNDPNSEIVTPPRPDWNHAVRYWRALNDPDKDYTPTSHIGSPNTYFLARTPVDDPFNVTDAWNQYNQNWANAANAASGNQGINWAPIPRVVWADYDLRADSTGKLVPGARTKTLQPGYPWLYAKSLFTQDTAMINRFYRDHLKPLTPESLEYDVTSLTFDPLVVSGEWLAAVPGSAAGDYSSYLAHYPLWRLGVPSTNWPALTQTGVQGQNLIFGSGTAPSWACDPFLLIYHAGPNGYPTTGPTAGPTAIGCFDTRSRSMKIITPPTSNPLNPSGPSIYTLLYDTCSYPARTLSTTLPNYGFGVDWINGCLRSDFPPLDLNGVSTAEAPLPIYAASLHETSARYRGSSVTVYDFTLSPWAESGRELPARSLLGPRFGVRQPGPGRRAGARLEVGQPYATRLHGRVSDGD